MIYRHIKLGEIVLVEGARILDSREGSKLVGFVREISDNGIMIMPYNKGLHSICICNSEGKLEIGYTDCDIIRSLNEGEILYYNDMRAKERLRSKNG
ncbi:hypothetical protein HZA33_01170 [Candidatus Pacearchaeota archaeon]|nr:hypothetical protein [Candidatus Pacearchaeota archaeon]